MQIMQTPIRSRSPDIDRKATERCENNLHKAARHPLLISAFLQYAPCRPADATPRFHLGTYFVSPGFIHPSAAAPESPSAYRAPFTGLGKLAAAPPFKCWATAQAASSAALLRSCRRPGGGSSAPMMVNPREPLVHLLRVQLERARSQPHVLAADRACLHFRTLVLPVHRHLSLKLLVQG
jgi:hypothetical protein